MSKEGAKNDSSKDKRGLRKTMSNCLKCGKKDIGFFLVSIGVILIIGGILYWYISGAITDYRDLIKADKWCRENGYTSGEPFSKEYCYKYTCTTNQAGVEVCKNVPLRIP